MTTAPFEPFNDAYLNTLPDTPAKVDLEVKPADVPLAQPKLVSVYTDDETGDVIEVYDDKTERVRKKGTKKLDATTAAEAASAKRLAEKVSAFDILRRGMAENGLESLADAVHLLIRYVFQQMLSVLLMALLLLTKQPILTLKISINQFCRTMECQRSITKEAN